MELIRYDKSHMAKLTFLSDKMKMYYTEIKNYILSFTKVKNSTSWEGERFYVGRNTLIRFVCRGKSINLYFALTPSTLDPKYGVVDVSDIKKYADLPAMLKMKGPRSFNYAKELIDELMEAEEIAYNEEFEESYGLELKSRSLESLLKEGLIKPVYGNRTSTRPVTLEDNEDEDFEEEEEEIVEDFKPGYKVVGLEKYQVGRCLRTIIDLSLLENNYNDGQTVSLDSLKEKNLIDINIMYVKLLASPNFTKKLNIELNEYSKSTCKILDSLYK